MLLPAEGLGLRMSGSESGDVKSKKRGCSGDRE